MKKTVAFHTLGCKLNFTDTGALERNFEASGFLPVPFEERADVYVINSCSVTEQADRECRTIINRALTKNPSAFIAVTGCFAQLKPGVIAEMEGVDLVAGISEKFNLVNHIGEAIKRNKAEIFSCDIDSVESFHGGWTGENRTRTFLKVQDGCDYNCSFCTIPLARGKSRSNSILNIYSEACSLAEDGVKEIVLSGVNLGDFHYTNSSGHYNFLDLITQLEKIPFPVRFRISSIEPNLLDARIIEFVAQSKKFVPHFHIPLQSGSDSVLKRMRRRYLTSLYQERILKIQSEIPHAFIGADVITGFPGETQDDFLQTMQFIESLQLCGLHVFTYSERDHTHALQLDGVVPYAERKRRTHLLRQLSDRLKSNFNNGQTGRVLHVIFENSNHNGFMYGYSENFIRVKSSFYGEHINKILPVMVNTFDEKGIGIGEVKSENLFAVA